MKKATKRQMVVSAIAEKVKQSWHGRIEFHGGSYTDGIKIRTVDGNSYHIVNVCLNDHHIYDESILLDIDLWSEVTEQFSVCEEKLTLPSLKKILVHLSCN